MEISDRDLEYYLAQVRRTAESRTKSAEKEIRKIYKDMLKDLKQFLGDAYAADADPNDRLSFTDLNQKRKYARFIEEAAEIVNGKLPAAMKETQEVVAKVYSLSHKGMIEAVKKSTTSAELKKELKGIRAATAEMIKRAAQNPLHGLTLSQTLERNRKEVVFEIQQMLNIGLMNGDRYSTMAKRITERVDIDYRKAVRIVRTETHRVREAGFNDSATDINETLKQGVTAQRLFKTWQTMEDERVRDTSKANHRKMNGVSVGMDEDFDLGNGVKAPVPGQSGSAANDCNCRCFVVYELKEDEEAAKKLQEEAAKQQYRQFDSGDEANKYFGERHARSLRREDRDEYERQLEEYEKSPFGAWREALSFEQERAIGEYSADSYSGINGLLRGEMTRKMADAWNATGAMQLQDMIDEITSAIDEFELREPIKVFRTCERDVLRSLSLEVGSAFHDDGFVSTSVITDKVASGHIVLQINVPAGKGVGAWINPLSGAEDEEYEFLLQRGSDFVVKGIRTEGEDTVVELDLVGDTRKDYHYASREDVIRQWKERGIYDEEAAERI